jgi:hypothetical protein
MSIVQKTAQKTTTDSATVKQYTDCVASGVHFRSSPPPNPILGDAYYDNRTGIAHVWTGASWHPLSTDPHPKALTPTAEQLEKHPALKEAWDEYMVIRRLLGI